MANLTPMIDVVFQLIIFFLLAAQFSRQQTIEMELPLLEGVATPMIDREGRAVINLVPESMRAELGGSYRLGSRTYQRSSDQIDRLTDVLASLRERDPNQRVVIRAARNSPYEHVHPLLRALAAAGIHEVDLAALESPEGGPR